MKRKTDLYYFSGTGNTEKIAQVIQGVLENESIETRLISISDKTKVALNEDCTVGLAFPVNAHATCPFIWKFIKKLPKANGEHIFVVYTLNDKAAIGEPVINILKKKGYKVIGIKEFQMPNHLITQIEQTKDNEKRLYSSMVEAEQFARCIAKGEKVIEYKNNGSRLLSSFNRNTGIPFLFMRIGFKLENNKSKCKICKKCIDECPVQNIEIKDSRIIHKFKCNLCMKCIANCPNKAIQINGNDKFKVV